MKNKNEAEEAEMSEEGRRRSRRGRNYEGDAREDKIEGVKLNIPLFQGKSDPEAYLMYVLGNKFNWIRRSPIQLNFREGGELTEFDSKVNKGFFLGYFDNLKLTKCLTQKLYWWKNPSMLSLLMV